MAVLAVTSKTATVVPHAGSNRIMATSKSLILVILYYPMQINARVFYDNLAIMK